MKYLIVAIVSFVFVSSSRSAIHSDWPDLADRSVIIKTSEPAFILTSADSSAAYSPQIVLSGALLAKLEEVTPVSIQRVFYQYEQVYGGIQGVSWDYSYVIAYPDETDMEAVSINLRDLESVQYCTKNKFSAEGYCDAQFNANNEYSEQWYLQAGAPGGIGFCQAKQYESLFAYFIPRVGVLDTGVMASSDFNISGDSSSYCRLGNTNSFVYYTHGTEVFTPLGSLASNPIGAVGVLEDAVFTSYAFECSYTLENWAAASMGAIGDGNNVVITSHGVPSANFEYIAWNVAKVAYHNGICFIAAGGNAEESLEYLTYPGRFRDTVLAVSATDVDGEDYPGYTRGRTIDIAAPGRDIVVRTFDPSTGGNGHYTAKSGTSYAAPIVAGAVSLLMRVKPGLDPEDYAGILASSCTDVSLAGQDSLSGHGRLNIGEAMRRVCDLGYKIHWGSSSNVISTQSSGMQQGYLVGFTEYIDGEYKYVKTTYNVLAHYGNMICCEDPDSVYVWGKSNGTSGLTDMQYHSGWDRYILNTDLCFADNSTADESEVLMHTYSYDIYDVDTEAYLGHVGPSGSAEVVVSYGVLYKACYDVQYSDMSDATGLEYAGTPYSSAPLDYDGNGMTDFVLTILDEPTILASTTHFVSDGVPALVDRSSWAFPPGSIPPVGQRGASTADIDNDGDDDFFAASANEPRLYLNGYNHTTSRWEFVDITASAGINSSANMSSAGIWGDYDRDSDLDLFICRANYPWYGFPTAQNIVPLPDVLLRNDLNKTGLFSDVSSAAEGMATVLTGPTGASWSDFDSDGDLDLLVPSLMDYNNFETARLYVNQDNGTFTEEFSDSDHFGTPSLYWVSGLQWVDIDNDGDLDVVTATDAPMASPQRAFINTSGHFAEHSLGMSMMATGLKVIDADLDGRQDLLFLPANALGPSGFSVGIDPALRNESRWRS